MEKTEIEELREIVESLSWRVQDLESAICQLEERLSDQINDIRWDMKEK